MAKEVLMQFLLPRSLAEQFEATVHQDGQKPSHAFRAAVAGFLKMTPEQRAAAMKAVEHLVGELRVPRGRRKKDTALGLAILLKIKHPDRMIG